MKKKLAPNRSRSVIDFLWITRSNIHVSTKVQMDPPKIIKNRLNFALSKIC